MITGTPTAAPVAVFGTSSTGVKIVANDGDSINTEVGDWATGAFNSVAYTNVVYGDADGAVAFGNRALNAAGYSSVRTAIPGTKASQVTSYGGDNHRALIRRYASATLTNHLHNDEGVQASGAAMITVMQAYNNHLRAGMLSGSAKRVVNMSGTPATTSSNVTLASLTYSGTTATATTTSAHNLSTGAYVVIAGATPSGFNTGVARRADYRHQRHHLHLHGRVRPGLALPARSPTTIFSRPTRTRSRRTRRRPTAIPAGGSTRCGRPT